MIACGRCCCICRRFAPLHLQIHHIREQALGGTDDPDNLIAVCLTCHSDVHTRTQLTRRFSEAELKGHRDEVFRLVADGKLPAGPAVPFASASFDAVRAIATLSTEEPVRLSATQARLLVAAAVGDARFMMARFMGGEVKVVAGGTVLLRSHDNRAAAEYEEALEQLESSGLIRGAGQGSVPTWRLTHQGYLAADQLQAAGSAD